MALLEEFESSGNWLFKHRSYLPLLVFGLIPLALMSFTPMHDRAATQAWEIFCLCISLAGLGVRVYTVGHAPKGTSGRNTTKQVADVLNTTGMYSIVRHPLYVGNFFMWFGVSMFFHEWWFSAIIGLVYWVYYERIMFAEEAFLRRQFGDVFIKWAEVTPAFIPRFGNWKSPNTSFGLKTVLKREQSGLLGVTASFTLLDVIVDYFTDGKLGIETMWLIIFMVSLCIYLTLTGLKKAKVI